MTGDFRPSYTLRGTFFSRSSDYLFEYSLYSFDVLKSLLNPNSADICSEAFLIPLNSFLSFEFSNSLFLSSLVLLFDLFWFYAFYYGFNFVWYSFSWSISILFFKKCIPIFVKSLRIVKTLLCSFEAGWISLKQPFSALYLYIWQS